MRLCAGCVVQDRVERRVVNGAGQGLRCAVGTNDYERRLHRYLEAEIHVAGIIADRRERQLVLVDEALKGGLVAGPGNTDELD